MRKYILVFSALYFSLGTVGQMPNKNECPVLKQTAFDIFLPGYSDTLQPNGMQACVINVASVVDGFELLCNDSSVKILGYCLMFDTSDGDLVYKCAKGSKMTELKTDFVSLQSMKESSFITIEHIKVQSGGKCYSVRPQLYYLRKLQ